MEYLREIISFIVGAIAGGVTMKIYCYRNNQEIVNQSNNKVGGDMAGRDVIRK